MKKNGIICLLMVAHLKMATACPSVWDNINLKFISSLVYIVYRNCVGELRMNYSDSNFRRKILIAHFTQVLSPVVTVFS
jgi:hypothetical protein